MGDATRMDPGEATRMGDATRIDPGRCPKLLGFRKNPRCDPFGAGT